MYAAITSVSHFVPDKKLTNQDLEKTIDTTDLWITERTGIKERRILESGKGSAFMAVNASKIILEERKILPNEIDLIITATVTPDMPVPTTASFIQKELKASNCWGFDLNGGCSGFICALSVGSQFIQTGKYKKILVIGTDKMSSIIDYQDRNTCIIFGDAAGAVLLEPSNEFGIKDFDIYLDGIGTKYLSVPAGGSLNPASLETVEKKMHYVFQDGKVVFKYAVNSMIEATLKLMKKNNLEEKDINLFIPHQANLRIIDAVARRIGLDTNKVIINIHKYGNTTDATIPMAISEAYREKKIKKGDWIILSAFGAGFTWGSMLLKWALD